jgi:hypothetical protein
MRRVYQNDLQRLYPCGSPCLTQAEITSDQWRKSAKISLKL